MKGLLEHIRTLHFYPNNNNKSTKNPTQQQVTAGGSTLSSDNEDLLNSNSNTFMLLQLYTDLMFIKQAYMYILKDTSEIDRLIDQNVTAISNRCCVVTKLNDDDSDVNSSSSMSAAEEGYGIANEDYSMIQLLENYTMNNNNNHNIKILNRCIGDAMYNLSKKCVLFHR